MNDLQHSRTPYGIGSSHSPIGAVYEPPPASVRQDPLSLFMSSVEPNSVSTTSPSASLPPSSATAAAESAANSNNDLPPQRQSPNQHQQRHRRGSRQGSRSSNGSGSGSHGEVEVPDPDDKPPTPEQVREVVRFMQCPICSYLLHEPVTLPCGRSLCKRCLPDSHVRANISYPATANRRQAYTCPFPDCERDHPVGDCSVDVVLNKAVVDAQAELEKGRDAARLSELTMHIVAREGWEATGVPSLREAEPNLHVFPGGRLLAAYGLAQTGELDYNAEVTFESPATTEHEKLDMEVLKKVKEVVRSEVDCQVCYALYCDPVTTPCGHTFCRPCLQRVLDHARYCPVCRRALTIQPILNMQASPPNRLLTNITTAFWSDVLEARREAIAAEALHDGTTGYDIPVFVCTLSFPQMPTFLHIFEPRYRLMIRRALEGDQTFGMVLHHNGSFTELGTILRIVNAEFYPDGRSVIETVGVSRFRILNHGEVDGYMVARVQRITDISIVEEEELEAEETRDRVQNSIEDLAGSVSSSSSPSTSALHGSASSSHTRSTSPSSAFPTAFGEIETTRTSDLMDFAVDFVREMREQSVRWLTARVLAIYGECPRDPAIFPWWLASVLPVSPDEKYRLLGTTSVRERLKICCGWILEWERTR